MSGCCARLYIRGDGTAYRKAAKPHSNHGTQYTKFKEAYCFNRMKEKAVSAPASVTPYEIYKEVVME